MAELSAFDGVTNVMYGSWANRDEVERSARMALSATGEPQGVHMHARTDPCVRGGGCYVLRRSRCPDDGACHHDCVEGDCWRVRYASPLSASGWDEWPTEIIVNKVLGRGA